MKHADQHVNAESAPAKTRERRQGNVRAAIFGAAEMLFSEKGYAAVSIRDIATAAGAHPGSVTYHFGTKNNLLREIYDRHCGPMNHRRMELLREAKRIRSREERLSAIIRAYVIPAFSSLSDSEGGGAQFTRLRAVLSAESDPDIREIIAEAFDDTTNAFLDALAEALPELDRGDIVWRSQFLLGSLYYTLINPERVTRLSRGAVDGGSAEDAIDHLVNATVAGLLGRPGSG